jgi:hypothetical protein
MSVLCSILQVGDGLTSEDIIAYLGGEGITPPPNFKPGRFPAPREWRQVLDNLSNCTVEYKIDLVSDRPSWEVFVDTEDQYFIVYSLNYSKDDNVPLKAYFQGHPEFIKLILRELARYCGWVTFLDYSDLKDLTFISPNQGQ